MRARKNLLMDMLRIESISGKEDEIRELVKKELETLGFNVSIDSKGNVSAIRGDAKTYPLLNAHMDIVDISYDYSDFMYWYKKGTQMDEGKRNNLIHDVLNTVEEDDLMSYGIECRHCSKFYGDKCPNKDMNLLCNEYNPSIFGETMVLEIARDLGYLHEEEIDTEQKEETYTVYCDKNGMIRGKGKERVLGGDDKCGLFIAIEVARMTKNLPMKILFTVEEEIGLVGIKHFIEHNKAWFNDVKYSITIDRKGTNHLLWSQCGKRSCDNTFASKLASAGVMAGIGVNVRDGGVSDVIYIREMMNAVNISAGYFEAHSAEEYIDYNAVKKIINWVKIFLTEN